MKGTKREDKDRSMSSADLNDTGVNEKVKIYFDKVDNDYTQANRFNLLKYFKQQFESVVDGKKGEGYFDKHAPQM